MGAHDDAAAEIERLLSEAAELLEGGDPSGALELTRRGARLARRGVSTEAAGELALLEGIALTDLGEPEEALPRLDAALSALPGDVDAMLERGLALYELCRFEEARAQLLEVTRREPREPWAHHTLGLIAERRGDPKEAARHLARARALAPDEFAEPAPLPAEEFDGVVEDALASLPDKVRSYLSNVAIAVEPLPAEEDLRAADPPLSPSILGVFRGAPLGQKASMDPWSHFPSSIVLYQRNLERFARDREELVEQIGVTLLHEVGHFLGLDEEELRRLGLD